MQVWVNPRATQEVPHIHNASERLANRRDYNRPSWQERRLAPKAPAGPRTFDERLCMWTSELPPVTPEAKPARSSALPQGDGSGRYWLVSDRGQPMWTFDAYTNNAAQSELERLCSIAGYDWRKLALRTLQIGR
jgi:hypothetical protein